MVVGPLPKALVVAVVVVGAQLGLVEIKWFVSQPAFGQWVWKFALKQLFQQSVLERVL